MLFRNAPSKKADALSTRLDSEWRVRYDVAISIHNEANDVVAEMTVVWHVRSAGIKPRAVPVSRAVVRC